jgi:hypothetical protein
MPLLEAAVKPRRAMLSGLPRFRAPKCTLKSAP